LRAGTRTQLQGVRQTQQIGQARERALDALLQRIDIPLPDKIVEAEVEARKSSMVEQLERMGSSLDGYLEAIGQTAIDFDADRLREARQGLKTTFVLDQLAMQEDLSVEPDEMSAYVTERARRLGVEPDRLAKQLADNGQLGQIASEILRGKAIDIIAQRAKVTDEAGREVDIAPPAAAADEPSSDADDESE
jgi:trigger factor